MKFFFDGMERAGAEPSARTAFAGNRLERMSEDRPPDCLSCAIDDPRARFIVAADGQLVTQGTPGELLARASLADLGIDPAEAILLGNTAEGAPRLAVAPSRKLDEDLPPGFAMVPLRALYMEALVDAGTMGEIAQGAALLNWTIGCRFCGQCGTQTVSELGGYRRRCDKGAGGCGRLHFPRTDPVVIMLAVDEARDRCLLGRSPHFAPGMYSCLAGFLEPGETMEDAVRRETGEEAGITIGRVRYHASQPWPLPHTIMVGFYAEATSVEIDHDRDELEDCRWFTRAEAARLLERRTGETMTAPDGTIANRLVADWIAAG